MGAAVGFNDRIERLITAPVQRKAQRQAVKPCYRLFWRAV